MQGTIEEIPDKKVNAWIKFACDANPSITTPENVGFPSDDFLRKKISIHIGKKCPPKKTPIPRPLLCDIAVNLNLVLREEAELAPPRRTHGTTSWFDLVNNSMRRQTLVDASSTEWLDDDDLQKLLEDYTGEIAPGNQSRSMLMKMAKYLNLVSDLQADIPRPEYLKIEELQKRWDARDKSSETKKVKKPIGRKALIKALFTIGLVTRGEFRVRVLRDDRAEKADKAKGTTRSSRGATFAGLFEGIDDAYKIKAAITDICDKTSLLVHQRGFLVWLVLYRIVTETLAFPNLRGRDLSNFIRRCFVVGTPGSGSDKKDATIIATLKKYKQLFPDLSRPIAREHLVRPS